MLRIGYKPAFLRQFKKLSPALQRDVRDRSLLFRRDPKHSSLYVHKLKGALRGQWSFSVNYQYRIVFIYEGKNTVVLLAVGGHDVYG
ncbi:MAG: type II toxin-antitoxin system RelE/ParE family toxin [Candidatus Peribacteraceae bacterium]|nr:type II toxin-antitoxin system RelE/ParE family toxin [Candidatus Peribacteraceae bacterium]